MITPNQAARPGRMLAALIASENKKGRMELTVTIAPHDATKATLHRAFTIKKWTPKNGGAARLYIALPDTADWHAGIRPVTPLAVDLTTGEVKADKNDPRVTPQLIYAASQALNYARTGTTGSPANGTVTVKEAALCGHCGAKLTDPISIDRGIGPHCFGKTTGSKAIKLGETITGMAAQLDAAAEKASEIAAAAEAVAKAEARIAAGDHSEQAYDRRDEARKWLFKAHAEVAA